MERLTEKHYLGTDHYMKCSGNCNVDMDCIDCPSFDRLIERLAAYKDTGLEPEEIDMDHEAAEQLRHLCRNCDIDRLEKLDEADKNGRVVVLPRWKNEEERLERRRLMRIMADGAIDRLMENPLKEENGPDIAELRVVNTDRLLELAKADEDGRLFLLPMKPGRPMLCQEYFERPWVMKNVTLCVQYKSSAGIIFYMGYDVFRGLVERGRITPLSQEGEEMLGGESECLTSTRCRMRNGSKSPCRPSCL